jgi:hypothetical protein
MFFDICWSGRFCTVYKVYQIYRRNLKFQKDISIFKSELTQCTFTHTLRQCTVTHTLRQCTVTHTLRQCTFTHTLRQCTVTHTFYGTKQLYHISECCVLTVIIELYFVLSEL